VIRKTLLVVVLVASSFSGGAVVNGPGLKYAQSWIQARIENSGGAEVEVADAELDGFPTAPMPPIVSEETSEVAAPGLLATQTESPAPEPAPPADPAVTPAATPPAETPAPPPTAPPAAPAATPAPANATPPAQPAPAATTPAPATTDWADAPDSQAPAAAVVPGRPAAGEEASAPPPLATPTTATEPPASTPTPAPAEPAATAEAWTLLSQRMSAAGITRYWVEGEPGGRVRFRCAIPLAGERAVAQQFEAEADDLPAAAQAALNRITLWRATEAP
jgi:hypothetical protein